MLVVVNHLEAPDEAAAGRIEQGFRHAGGMKDVPGCARFELWKSQDGRRFEVVTHWRSEADFEAWRNSDAFRHAHRDTSGTQQVQSRLLLYEVVVNG